MSTKLFTDIGLMLSMQPAAQKQGRKPVEADLGMIPKAAMITEKNKIIWVGPEKHIPKQWARKKVREISMDGATVLPGFTECHTHSVFAGSRAQEFEWRLQGISYKEIAARGGGILSTMKATRQASPKLLLQRTQQAANEFLRQGVTTLEIKSGYGLNLEGEIKCLQVLKKLTGPKIVGTFLGAHAKPPEFDNIAEYLKYLAIKVLPEVRKKKLAERVDIFIEDGFFSGPAAQEYLQTAKDLGFALTIHADQLSLSGGTAMAVKLGAQSADHLIQLDEKHVQTIAKSETTAVLLPAADLYMRCAYPPARALIDAGARVALATDFNPGTSPTQDLSLVGLLARLQMKMTLPEVLVAYTYNAAAALNRQQQVGSLEVGKHADFISTTKDWSDLFYSAGQNAVDKIYIDATQSK